MEAQVALRAVVEAGPEGPLAGAAHAEVVHPFEGGIGQVERQVLTARCRGQPGCAGRQLSLQLVFPVVEFLDAVRRALHVQVQDGNL